MKKFHYKESLVTIMELETTHRPSYLITLLMGDYFTSTVILKGNRLRLWKKIIKDEYKKLLEVSDE